MNRMVRFSALVGVVWMMPGCVVTDIRDELVAVNQKIDTTNAQLDELQVKLQSLERMASIDSSLESIDGSLKSVDGQLDTIETSLSRLDEHLASLRKTINNIDSTIPFLKISGDDAEDKAELNAEEGEEKPTPTSGEDGNSGGGSDPGR